MPQKRKNQKGEAGCPSNNRDPAHIKTKSEPREEASQYQPRPEEVALMKVHFAKNKTPVPRLKVAEDGIKLSVDPQASLCGLQGRLHGSQTGRDIRSRPKRSH
jgi:hypothetical protein